MIKRYLTSLVYGLSIGLFCSFSAMATVCFLPDGSCGGVNYGYKDESGSTCTYKTRDEANLKKGECEEVQKQGFCFYLTCSMSKSDCDKAAANAPNHDKCCVPCGNCWKVADCSIPQIETCTGANYETEQTCKNKNQNFKPNGKFDKNGTACGECKDVPYITCPEMGDYYVTRAECTAKGSSFTFASANVKDSGGNECGTCVYSEPETCTSGYSTAYQSQADCASNETFSSKGTANGKVCGKCTASTPECTPKDCSEYTYTTLSDLSNTASYEQCDNGCGTTTYRCKSGYTYSGGKCVEPPAQKCTDVAATENKLEEIHQYETISAKKTEDITSAVLGCGKNPIYAKEGGIGKTSSSLGYGYGSGPGPVYRMDSTTGKWYVLYNGRCMENLRCGAVVGEGYTDYTSFDNSDYNDTSLDRVKYYCCKQNVFQRSSGYSESEINSILNQSCKTKPSGSEKPAPFSPYYVCDKGTMDYNRQCHLGTYSYSCPIGYTLSGEKCINKKANCPTGYKASAKDATSYYCRKTTYTCPTNFDYTLSGDKCYCKKDTPDCDGITRFKNVTYDMVMNMDKICPGGSFVHDGKCYYCGKGCAQLYAGAKSKCGENETATPVGQDEAGNSCYTCEVGCNKTLTSGKIANGSTVYYYVDKMPYLAKSCPFEMTLNVACKYFIDAKQMSSEDYSTERVTVLYINGAHNLEIPGQPDLVRNNTVVYSNSFMTCSGCGNVTCEFKYGGNKVSVSTTVEWGGYYTSRGAYYQIRER